MGTIERRFTRSALALTAVTAVGIGALAPPANAQTPGVERQRASDFSQYDGPILMIGPVQGLTEGWHRAPKGSAVPLGAMMTFRVSVPLEAQVMWSGAIEVSRDEATSVAVCPVTELGRQQVAALVRLDGVRYLSHMLLDAVDVAVEDIAITSLHVKTGTLKIDESVPQDEINEQTMAAYFGPSIAPLREIGADRYLTSVDRVIPLTMSVDPPGFAPLIETRIDGVPRALGASASVKIADIGMHEFSVGRPAAPQLFTVDTYDVLITSHKVGDYLPRGETITFTAATDPPGYEDEIVWLSSTKFGSATPVLGHGPTFEMRFDDTMGRNDGGDLWEWKGVKAGSVAMGQDQKPGELTWCGFDCPIPKEEPIWCEYQVTLIRFDPPPPAPGCGQELIFPGAIICVAPCPWPGELPCEDGFNFVTVPGGCEFSVAALDRCQPCFQPPDFQWERIN